MEHFIVRESSAKMPASCWGKYKRFGILRLANGSEVQDIPEHTRSWAYPPISESHPYVEEVVCTWERCNEGTSDRCAAAIARKEAHTICAALNILYKRSSRPSMRKVAAFVREHGSDSLPNQELGRYHRADRYTGTVNSVLALHGYSGLARAVSAGSPLAVALRRRLNNDQLSALDHALHTTERSS